MNRFFPVSIEFVIELVSLSIALDYFDCIITDTVYSKEKLSVLSGSSSVGLPGMVVMLEV